MNLFIARQSAFHFSLKPLMGALVALAIAPQLHAQSFCASNGQVQPVQLMERFINADCESCWTDPATPKAATGTIALDWVTPGSQGDDAPLSTVVSRDSLLRLQALGQEPPSEATSQTRPVQGLRGAKLRVAHGLPLADYLGTSIELKPIPASVKQQMWTSWLVMVETLPAGVEGSPVERNLVRNTLSLNWDGRKPLSKGERNRFYEARSMWIAPAANPNRLRVIGWVENQKGKIVAAAQSRCTDK